MQAQHLSRSLQSVLPLLSIPCSQRSLSIPSVSCSTFITSLTPSRRCRQQGRSAACERRAAIHHAHTRTTSPHAHLRCEYRRPVYTRAQQQASTGAAAHSQYTYREGVRLLRSSRQGSPTAVGANLFKGESVVGEEEECRDTVNRIGCLCRCPQAASNVQRRKEGREVRRTRTHRTQEHPRSDEKTDRECEVASGGGRHIEAGAATFAIIALLDGHSAPPPLVFLFFL